MVDNGLRIPKLRWAFLSDPPSTTLLAAVLVDNNDNTMGIYSRLWKDRHPEE
jgi:hypothetical protein